MQFPVPCPLFARALPAVLLALLALVAHGATEWSSQTPWSRQLQPVPCPVDVLDGAFEFEARLTLGTINGTAASVMIGPRLNFGFDSRSKTLFVEGPAIGRTVALAPARDHLRAGTPFLFRAKRDEAGTLTIAIDDETVYTTRGLRGPVGTITVRPHRNTVDIHALRISGSIEVPEPGLTLRRTIIPVLADGESHALLDLDLVLEQPGILRSVCIDLAGTTRFSDLGSLALQAPDQQSFATVDGSGPTVVLEGSLDLPAGRHRLQLLGTVKSGTDPLHKIAAACKWMAFADGSRIAPHPAHLPPLRIAYPIHQQGQFGCHTFRIPAVARANDGTLLAVYDMRYNSRRDLQEHIDIGLSRSTDGGRTWSHPVPIMDMGTHGGKPQEENGCSDPGIIVDANTGEILVAAVWTHGKPGTHQWRGTGSEPGHGIHQSSQFMIVRSNDHGNSWSPPENWTKRLKNPAWWLFAPAPGNGITLSDGTLVMPTQGRDATGHPFSNITWSRDHGKTWTVSHPARDDTTECAVAALSDGSLLLNMRDNRNRSDTSGTNGRGLSITRNLGATWAKHPSDHGALPEPTCMASMIAHTLADGRHILVFSNPRNKESRRDMTIQLSFDDGKTWPARHHLLLDEKGGAYSSLVMIDHHTLGILYESSQADMVFQKIALQELIR